MLNGEQVVVNESPVMGQLGAALRNLMVAIGGYMVGRGWLNSEITTAAVPVLAIAGPIIWSQIRVRINHQKSVAIKSELADAIAATK